MHLKALMHLFIRNTSSLKYLHFNVILFCLIFWKNKIKSYFVEKKNCLSRFDVLCISRVLHKDCPQWQNFHWGRLWNAILARRYICQRKISPFPAFNYFNASAISEWLGFLHFLRRKFTYDMKASFVLFCRVKNDNLSKK